MGGDLKVHDELAPNGGPPIICPPRTLQPTSYSAASYLAWGLGQLADFISRTRRFPKSRYLQGNFAPVHRQLDATECVVEFGALPVDLCGDYARIGPNPLLEPVAE